MEIPDNIQTDDVAIFQEALIQKSYPCQFHWAKVMVVDLNMQCLCLYKEILTTIIMQVILNSKCLKITFF